jgi:hypothetical protein
MKAKDTPLKVSVEDGDLVIRIGADRLAYCALAKNGGSLPRKAKITDALAFAVDVACSLNRDEEDGENDVNRLLPAACMDAAVNGSPAVDWPLSNALDQT